MKLTQHTGNKPKHNKINNTMEASQKISTTRQNEFSALYCGDFVVLWIFRCIVHYWATVYTLKNKGASKGSSSDAIE